MSDVATAVYKKSYFSNKPENSISYILQLYNKNLCWAFKDIRQIIRQNRKHLQAQMSPMSLVSSLIKAIIKAIIVGVYFGIVHDVIIMLPGYSVPIVILAGNIASSYVETFEWYWMSALIRVSTALMLVAIETPLAYFCAFLCWTETVVVSTVNIMVKQASRNPVQLHRTRFL